MPIVETLQKIGKYWRQGFSRPTVKNIDMGVFSDVSHDVTMAGGEDKNLSKITMGDRVVGFNPDTREKETYQVTGVEMLNPERFYYLINDRYAFHGKQSVMIGKNAIHVFRLRKGQKLQLENGTLEEITSIKRVYTPCPFIKLAIDGHHTFYLNGVLVHNASRYWVGGTASWNGTAGTKWATTSGGGGGSAEPTTSDDVFLDAASGTVTVTIATTAAQCLGFDCTGFTGTLAGSVAMTCAGSFKLVAGMTRSYTGAITFSSTSTGRTLTFNGKTMASNMTFNGVGGGWTLQDALSMTTNSITLTNGSLDTNGVTVTCQNFSSSNSNVRTLTLGASTINLRGNIGGIWGTATTTNLTFNAGTSTVNISVNSSTVYFDPGGLSFYNFEVTSHTGPCGFTSSFTVTNNLNLSGASTTSRLMLYGTTPGVANTITAAGITTFQNVDLIDVTGAGAASWTGTSIGDGSGNSGITFTTPVTRYWVGGTGSYNSTSEWSDTSGGAGGFSVPLIHDTVIFDANSFTAGGQTITLNAQCYADLDFTNVTNNPTISQSNNQFFFGDFIMKSGMSFTNTFAGSTRFMGNNNVNLSTDGVTPDFGSTTINIRKGGGATITLTGDTPFELTSSISLDAGNLDLNGFDLTSGTMGSSVGANYGSGNVLVDFGGGTWFMSTTAATTVMSLSTRITWTSDGFVDVNGNTANARTLSGSSGSTGPNTKISAGTGNVTISANTAFRDLDFTGYAGALQAGGAFNVAGSLTFSSGMTVTATANAITFNATSGTHNLTSNGITIDRPITFNGVGGTWSFVDDWTIGSSRTMTLTNGTVDFNDQDISVGLFSSSNSNTRALDLGDGTITLTGTGTVWNITTGGSFLTLTRGNSTIKINDSSASSKTFVGGTRTYNRLLLTGTGTGVFIINGSSTFAIFEADTPPHTIRFTASTTQTIETAAGWKVRGTAGNLMTIDSSSSTNGSISIASGTVVSDYLSIADNTATGGAAFYAGANSVDAGGGNSGWIFTAPAVAFSDAIALQDDVFVTVSRALNEVVTLVDSIATGLILTKVLDEAVALVDTVSHSISRAFSEAVTLVDDILNEKFILRSFNEAVELVDSLTKSLSIALFNSVTVVDSIVKSLSIALFNSVTLVDSLTRSIGRALVETVTLVASAVLYLNGLRAGIWKRVNRITSTWSKTSRVATTWDKVSRIVSTWTKIDRP